MVKVLDRMLLFFYTLVIGINAIVLLCAAFGWVPLARAESFLQDLYFEPAVAYPAITLTVIVLLLTARFFYLSIRRGRGNAPSIDQRTDHGDIRISLDTVENLALKAAGRVRGGKDLKARVSVADVGLEIVIRAVVDGESAIPELAEEMQRQVKDYVEQITGIPVSYVSVFVANVVQPNSFRSRVE